MNEMRIYVASLSDYNDGRLEGRWFDLSDYPDASDLMEAIQEMLEDITKKYDDGEVREEWAVHDYEGIPSTLASEYMGEQDFQKLYDIDIIAQEFGIPFEVLVERAGDTGVDDYDGYRSLADSLMFVVNGNDESDIVYEYEEQLGGLGNDFWSNHIYIDDVTERVMYGEDVDRFREDILYENPDMDEDEAERQAEEMADEEAERREDLTTYLEEMGYGDEIPSFVSKDYEGAWKRSLSYDFDVINHDGQMYVFSSNYSLGGTILSGMIGAYIGYKVGRAKPQKKGFETEKKIGRKVKGAFAKKKKMAKGGGVSYIKNWEVIGINKFGKMFKEKITLGRMSDKEDVKNALRRRTDLNIREVTSIKEVFAKGGGVDSIKIGDEVIWKGNKYLLTNITSDLRSGFYDKKYFLSSNQVGVSDAILDSLKDVQKSKYAQGGGVEEHKYVVQWLEDDNLNTEYYYSDEYEEAKELYYQIKYDLGDSQYKKVGINIMDMETGEVVFGDEFEYAKGGGIGFKELSRKVAKRYEGKSVPKEYQKEYGKRYSKSEAKEVGDKVAGKVYWQQQGRKMENGGSVEVNTEVILTENRIGGAKWRGVVKPFMLKSIEENQYKGGFKRYEIDIYDEVDREPTKEELKEANEFFDKIGGRYAKGGGVEGLNDLIRG